MGKAWYSIKRAQKQQGEVNPKPAPANSNEGAFWGYLNPKSGGNLLQND
jgi:hypothetical protein